MPNKLKENYQLFKRFFSHNKELKRFFLISLALILAITLFASQGYGLLAKVSLAVLAVYLIFHNFKLALKLFGQEFKIQRKKIRTSGHNIFSYLKDLFKQKDSSKKQSEQENHQLVIPLYFGWEIVMKKTDDISKHIIGPFKKYWQFMTVISLMIISVSTYLILTNYQTIQAATYGWIQSTWSGGASTTAVATHTSDQTGWTQYYSADDNISISSDQLTLSSGSSAVSYTTSDDFNGGTLNNSGSFAVDISGDEIKMFHCGDSITYSGIVYPTVLIGTQCWLAKNLNVGTYVTGATEQTDNSTIEKYCYSNNTANCTTYGGLYQWDEMMQYSTTAGVQGICPTGWHIPTDGEQNTLDQFLATGTCNASRSGTWDCDPAGTALKSGGSSGFNGLLAGDRVTVGSFNGLSSAANFWSSSESGTSAWFRYLNSTHSTVFRGAADQTYGFSVRCLKD